MFEQFVQNLEAFAAAEASIEAVVIVGSWANGTAKPESDIDVIMVTSSTDRLLSEYTWVYKFGRSLSSDEEDYDLVHVLRAFYDGGMEVEFGITTEAWLADDQLKATGKILDTGCKVVYDPKNLIAAFREKAKSQAVS